MPEKSSSAPEVTPSPDVPPGKRVSPPTPGSMHKSQLLEALRRLRGVLYYIRRQHLLPSASQWGRRHLI